MPTKVEGTYYIDLDNPAEGNAFGVGGLAHSWQKQLGEEPVSVLDGAQSFNEVLDRFDALFKGRIAYEFIHDPREGGEEDDDED